MNSKFAIAILAMALPCTALSQDNNFKCSYGELQRRVEILTEPGVSVPCEVHYYKDTEAPGEKQVLWRADSQDGYCESKTEEFIARLESMGWDCGRSAAAMPEPETATEPASDDDDAEKPPAYDDTDVLSPADPAE